MGRDGYNLAPLLSFIPIYGHNLLSIFRFCHDVLNKFGYEQTTTPSSEFAELS